jgi:hypothetical protein
MKLDVVHANDRDLPLLGGRVIRKATLMHATWSKMTLSGVP